MFLNAGWSGGTLYLAMVLLTLGFGLRHVVRDRGGDGFSAVLVGMALEGVVIDTDHWRHFYLFMAMIWGTTAGCAAPCVESLRRRLYNKRKASAGSLPDEAHDQEQEHRTQSGGDDCPQDATAEAKTEARKQGAGDQRAHNPDEDIAKQAEAGALDQLAGQPSGDCANNQRNKQCLKFHSFPPFDSPSRVLSAARRCRNRHEKLCTAPKPCRRSLTKTRAPVENDVAHMLMQEIERVGQVAESSHQSCIERQALD